jgi:O-antigen ligase
MSGRTTTWEQAVHLLWQSPWVGYGFQGDRYYLGQHMHDGFLHVFFQSGLLGGGAILIGLGIVWFYLIKYFFLEQPSDKTLIPTEMPAIFLFMTISSFTESTFAYFSAAWLLAAPAVAYVIALHWKLRFAPRPAVRVPKTPTQGRRRKPKELDPLPSDLTEPVIYSPHQRYPIRYV